MNKPKPYSRNPDDAGRKPRNAVGSGRLVVASYEDNVVGMPENTAGGEQGRGRGRGRGRGWGRGRGTTWPNEQIVRPNNNGDPEGAGRGRGRSSRVLYDHEEWQQEKAPAAEGSTTDQGEVSRKGNKPPLWTWQDFLKLKEADATNISSQLTNPKRDFAGFVKSDDLSPTTVELIFCVLGKLTSENGANVQPSTFTDIFLILTEARFFDRLSSVATLLATNFKTRLDEREILINRLLQNMASYFKVIIFAIPHSACNAISPKFFANFMALKPIIELNGINVQDTVFASFRELDFLFQEELNSRKAEKTTQPTESLLRQVDSLEVRPPDNFRRLSVMPTIEDLVAKHKPFLRPLIIQGEYPSVAEYLDVQFRLLREDFYYPLRTGIQEYMKYTRINGVGESKRKKKLRFDNVRLYFEVKVESCQVTSGSHIISFSVEGLQTVQWDCSKRLLFGSLLILTSDNFRSILLATIMNRKSEELAKGRLEVKFEDSELHQEKLKKVFTMVESNVYFEAYRSTLETLQKIADNELALKEYFLGQMKQPRLPKYLQERTRVAYDLSCLIKDETPVSSREEGRPGVESLIQRGIAMAGLGSSRSRSRELEGVDVLDPNAWPAHEDLNMDSSQAAALHAALTQEVAIIQGPPGTGKTFLGLKITQALLENSELWQGKFRSPIVVVCYTNHALDQFLEGMMSFTRNIIRVGGQSRNENLAQFSLSRRRYAERYRRHDLTAWSYGVKNQMDKLLGRILYLENGVNSMAHVGIASRQVLHEWGVLNDNALRFFQTITLSNWLFVERETVLRDTVFCLKQVSPIQGPSAVRTPVPGTSAATEANPAPAAQQNAATNDEEEEWEKEEIDDILEQRLAFEEDIRRDILDLNQLLERCKFPPFLEYGLPNIDEEIEDLNSQLSEDSPDKEFTRAYLVRLQVRRALLADILKCIPALTPKIAEELMARPNMWQMSITERWMLYGYWRQQLKARMEAEGQKLTEDYYKLNHKKKDIETAENAELCQRAAVVGLTTTGAAKHRQLLLYLKPKIVIVEEAAEVLEAHIVTSLSAHCEHLILIGDHQQLRPPTSVYHLAKDFRLDVSLFERLIRNGLPSNKLVLQHRMRPEVARLIVPHIYPVLENHESVLKYPHVRGIDKNVFFLTHTQNEDADWEGKSHLNRHEADMALALAKHLLLQGYEPNEVTILTTYSGQLLHMRKLRKQHAALKEVRITIVDNFQGEENEIIILSLVRSNEEQNIGFLRIENRICVALSRAKQGFYLLGNMDLLEGKSQVWQKISQTLANHREIGSSLPLRCVIHPEVVTEVSTARDFAAVAEGGCERKCVTPLLCGHICPRVCHVIDRSHARHTCRQPCMKINCPEGHPCPRKCHEDCGSCRFKVLRKLPCQHEKELPCYMLPSDFFCDVIVEKTLPICQHLVQAPCGKDANNIICTHKCMVPPPCGHQCTRTCHAKPEDDPDHLVYKCYAPCSRTICEEGHGCPGRCHQKCKQCEVMMERELPCGHKATFSCYFTESERICPVPVDRNLSACGHKVKMPCGESPDTFKCPLPCDIRLDCGHQCTQKCHVLKDPDHEEYRCQKPCNKTLRDCKRQHSCRKKCFEDCDLCAFKVTHDLPCGHRMDGPCHADPVVLCCDKLVSKTIPECGHLVTMKCSVAPHRRFCTKNCEKKLACGHICTQKCKEPCSEAVCQMPVPLAENLQCDHPVCVPCCERSREHKGEVWEATKEAMLLKCPEPCFTILPCEHACKGTCGRCSQGRIHQACEEKCGRPLVCGHSCKVNCSVSCPACTEPCSYRCAHSKCNKSCGAPCVDCKEPCTWYCEHYRCKKRCSEFCDRPRCDEACTFKLECSHDCAGLCGEPCPPLCRICNKEELTTIVFGNEDEEDAKFVWLRDCGHCIEVGALDLWMDKSSTEDEEILLKVCPLCKTPIQLSGRYGNVIKRHYKDIVDVKETLFGKESSLRTLLRQLHEKIAEADVPHGVGFSHLKRWVECLKNLTKVSKRKGKLPNLDHSKRYLVQVQTEIVLDLLNLAKEIVLPQTPTTSDSKSGIADETLQLTMFDKLNAVVNALFSRKQRISHAEYTDFKAEVRRLNLVRAFYVVRSCLGFKGRQNDQRFQAALGKVQLLERPLPLTMDQEKTIEVALAEMGEILQTGLGISDRERIEIVRALQLPKQGHWYKCPNGHIYVITECGGAMQESVCNECGAKIGGGSHRLLGDNSVASEMDGAQYPAWH